MIFITSNRGEAAFAGRGLHCGAGHFYGIGSRGADRGGRLGRRSGPLQKGRTRLRADIDRVHDNVFDPLPLRPVHFTDCAKLMKLVA